jgi:hypothetical protein
VASLSLCENCNERASAPFAKVAFEGGVSEDGVKLGRQEFPHLLCGDCSEAICRLDFATYLERHDNRQRFLGLP